MELLSFKILPLPVPAQWQYIYRGLSYWIL